MGVSSRTFQDFNGYGTCCRHDHLPTKKRIYFFMSSLIAHGLRCLYMVTLQVYTTTIFMGAFGSGSPKPHQLHSNDYGLLESLSNEAGYMSKDDRDKCPVQTTRRYIDSNGKRRCVGIPSALKESAYLVMKMLSSISLFYLFPISVHAPLSNQ